MATWAWDKVAGLNLVCVGRAWAAYMYCMLISGHCQPLAVSLSRPWSSMWPCVFVSVGTAISQVVLMWWIYRISCSRQVNIWICLIRSRRQMFLVIRLMRNWLKSK